MNQSFGQARQASCLSPITFRIGLQFLPPTRKTVLAIQHRQVGVFLLGQFIGPESRVHLKLMIAPLFEHPHQRVYVEFPNFTPRNGGFFV